MKRTTALVLVVVLLVSLFSGLTISASAAAYPYNPGTRHELCTALSSQAEAYYTGDYTFDTLLTLAGNASGKSLESMDSDLFRSLHTLMQRDLDIQHSYKQLADLWKYSDAQNGEPGVQLIYSDTTSSSYNREHVWPKSRGSFYQTNAGCDVQHLRPANSVINSTRSNHTMGDVRKLANKYSTKEYDGKTVLYYDASYDGVGLVEVNDNIKGDVARIMLYVYVTWGQPNLFENVSSSNLPPFDRDDSANNGLRVFNNLDTLLEWMQIDPVDSWEMGRNDVCQDIQGNRNVFIDYPELAWQLFDREIPSDYDTPSGYARNQGGSGVNYTVTAKANDDTLGSVTVSGKTVIANAYEGSYVAGYTLEPADAAIVTRSGDKFVLSKLTSDVTLTVNFARKTAASVIFSVPNGLTVTGAPEEPLYLGDTITLPTVSGTIVGEKAYTFVGWSAEPIQDATDVSTLHLLSAGSSYTLESESATFYAVFTYVVTEEGGDATLFAHVTAPQSDWSGTYMVANVKNSRAMSNEAEGTKYMPAVDVTMDGETIHNENAALIWTVKRQADGTYTVQDSDGLYLVCNGAKSLALVEGIGVETCNYWKFDVDVMESVASSCGKMQYNTGSPRFMNYTSSQAPIALFRGISGTTHYTTELGDLPENPCPNGHTWDEGKITLAPTCEASGVKTYTCTVCHTTKTETLNALGHDMVTDAAVPATCTEDGLTEGAHCSRCDYKVAQQTVPALGHGWDDGVIFKEATCTEAGEKTFTCGRCEATKTEATPALGHDIVVDAAVPATCTESGLSAGEHCSRCDYKVEQQVIPALGHSFENGSCTVCGAKDPDFKPIEFTDVNDSNWFAGAVKYVVSHNLFNGTGDGTTFSPNMAMSRAMLVTVLYRYEGEPANSGENVFSDVPNASWYTNAVVWASENGIVTGSNGKFMPNDPVSREQIATILFRYTQKQGKDTSNRADLSGFPDGDLVSGWAKDAMQWAVAEKLISGNTKGELMPKGEASRAEVATILMRFTSPLA